MEIRVLGSAARERAAGAAATACAQLRVLPVQLSDLSEVCILRAPCVCVCVLRLCGVVVLRNTIDPRMSAPFIRGGATVRGLNVVALHTGQRDARVMDAGALHTGRDDPKPLICAWVV